MDKRPCWVTLMEKRRLNEHERWHLLVFLPYTHSITDALLRSQN